jgi:hypothetical protein
VIVEPGEVLRSGRGAAARRRRSRPRRAAHRRARGSCGICSCMSYDAAPSSVTAHGLGASGPRSLAWASVPE